MRRSIIPLALLVCFASSAHARGIHARIEGPAPDGVTYTARTLALEAGDRLEPWALAEGVVEGKRQSWLIRVKPTNEPGVYQFTRTWPKDGLWMIRYNLGHPPAPATIVALRDGKVRGNRLFFNTDGSPECHKVLVKAYHLKADDDC